MIWYVQLNKQEHGCYHNFVCTMWKYFYGSVVLPRLTLMRYDSLTIWLVDKPVVYEQDDFEQDGIIYIQLIKL